MRTILAVCMLLATPLALAEHPERCESGGDLALGLVMITAAGETFYIHDTGATEGRGVYVYREANGIDGLQRGGASTLVPGDSEICTDVGDWEPDQRIV